MSYFITGINGRKIRISEGSACVFVFQVSVNGVVELSFEHHEKPQMDKYIAAEIAKGNKVSVGTSNGY